MRKGIFGLMSLPPCSLGCIVVFLLSPTSLIRAETVPPTLGLFQNHADIGTVLRAGSAQYDASHNVYSLAGGGENMWFTSDAFQFAWQQMTGDLALTADIAFPKRGGNPHRKAVLMMRHSLDADAPYADVAVHGDGLTSLQFREAKGSTTHEIQSNLSAPHRLRMRSEAISCAAGESGRQSDAARYYRLLLKVCDGSNSTRPELKRAKEVVAEK
jgi:TolB protein